MIKVSSAIYRKPPLVNCDKRFSSACSRTSSTSSSVSNFKRFSIKSNRNSEIDELLFATPAPIKINNNVFSEQVNNSNVSQIGKIKSYKCGKVSSPIRVLTQENVRQLRVINPSDDRAALILNRRQFQRLLDYQLYKKNPRENSREMELESTKRKAEMKYYDRLRKEKESLNDLEKEDLEKSIKLNKRAWEARLEDDCEVRKVNEMIKNAKVQSIRAHQIAEKNLIEKERLEEDMRLNKIIEEKRLQAVKEQQEKDRKRLENEYLAAISMVEQNFNLQNLKIIEREKEAEENFQSNQAFADLIENENASEQLRIKKQQKFKVELETALRHSQERKQMEILEDQLLNKKVMEIQKAKGEKEKIDEELRIQKATLREKEYSKMRQMQERILDMQSQRDELLERRSVEAHQRKWRKKELEDIIKQRKVEEELLATRLMQQKIALRDKVVEAKYDEIEFNKNLKVSKMILEQEQRDILNKQTKKDKFSTDIKHQIAQNQRQRIVDQYRMAAEEEAVRKEKILQEARLEEIKLRKLDELKTLGIDEKFLIPIKNYIKNPNFGKHLI